MFAYHLVDRPTESLVHANLSVTQLYSCYIRYIRCVTLAHLYCLAIHTHTHAHRVRWFFFSRAQSSVFCHETEHRCKSPMCVCVCVYFKVDVAKLQLKYESKCKRQELMKKVYVKTTRHQLWVRGESWSRKEMGTGLVRKTASNTQLPHYIFCSHFSISTYSMCQQRIRISSFVVCYCCWFWWCCCC